MTSHRRTLQNPPVNNMLIEPIIKLPEGSFWPYFAEIQKNLLKYIIYKARSCTEFSFFSPVGLQDDFLLNKWMSEYQVLLTHSDQLHLSLKMGFTKGEKVLFLV